VDQPRNCGVWPGAEGRRSEYEVQVHSRCPVAPRRGKATATTANVHHVPKIAPSFMDQPAPACKITHPRWEGTDRVEGEGWLSSRLGYTTRPVAAVARCSGQSADCFAGTPLACDATPTRRPTVTSRVVAQGLRRPRRTTPQQRTHRSARRSAARVISRRTKAKRHSSSAALRGPRTPYLRHRPTMCGDDRRHQEQDWRAGEPLELKDILTTWSRRGKEGKDRNWQGSPSRTGDPDEATWTTLREDHEFLLQGRHVSPKARDQHRGSGTSGEEVNAIRLSGTRHPYEFAKMIFRHI